MTPRQRYACACGLVGLLMFMIFDVVAPSATASAPISRARFVSEAPELCPVVGGVCLAPVRTTGAGATAMSGSAVGTTADTASRTRSFTEGVTPLLRMEVRP